ncbi:uncharacterized protein LOC136029404 isoform X2 [Artemia franciscana]|uniref:uncharacterized protein LOC136029404 isoform X2 n=1 Tax=Artemia franciscana TaxID=6661 RepID=UPI0032DB940D
MFLKTIAFLVIFGSVCSQRPNLSNNLDKLFSVARIGTLEDSSQCPCCLNNATAAECQSGRVVARPDCDCCFSCANQANEPCDGVNNLCDSDRGLHCGTRRVCEPQESCRSDRDCSSDKLCFGGACANPCKLFNPCARSLPSGICTTRDHRPVCSCAKGFENRGGVCISTAPEEIPCMHDGKLYDVGKSFLTGNCTQDCQCQPNGSFICKPFNCPSGFFRAGLNQDNLCFEKVESSAPDCCVRIVCESSPLEEEIVYYDEEPNGDFLPSDANGAIFDESTDAIKFPADQDMPIHLMATDRSMSSVTLVWDHQVPDGRSYILEFKERENKTWMMSDVLNGNTIILDNLKPSTDYDLRLGFMDTLTKKFVTLSEEITIRTEAGCYDSGISHPTNTRFSKGCESNCTCDEAGRLSCFPRCALPFYRTGTFKDDEFCEEIPAEDTCCVQVFCSDDSAEDEVVMKIDNAEGEGACTFKNETYARGENFFDGCEYTCECDQNSEILCKPRCAPLPDTIEMGCTIAPDPFDDCCSMVSCNKDQDGCTFKGVTYRKGESFFDGCEQRCQCVGFGDVECTPRCSPLGQINAEDCRVQQDPNDPCCSILSCSHNNTIAASELPFTTLAATTVGPKMSMEVNKVAVGEANTQLTSITSMPMLIEAKIKPLKISKVELVDNKRISMKFPLSSEMLDEIKSQPGFLRVARSIDLENWETENLDPTDLIQDPNNPGQVALEIPVSREEKELYLRVELGVSSSNTIAVETKATGIPREGTGCIFNEVIPIGVTHTDNCGLRCSCTENGRAVCDYSCEADQKSDCDNVQRCNDYEGKRTRKSLARVEDTPGNTKFADKEGSQFEGGRFPLIDKLLKELENSSASTSEPLEELSVDALADILEPAVDEQLKPEDAPPGFCSYKGQLHKVGAEFYDRCEKFCTCNEDGSVDCAQIECPSDFGLDLINPNCLDWETQSKSREPPNCCEEPKCLNDGSCEYKGETFRNFDEIPSSLSGCDKRCFCEFGNVTCNARCPPVTAVPPRNLPCDPRDTKLGPELNDECCISWQCGAPGEGLSSPEVTEIETPFGIQTGVPTAKAVTNLKGVALNTTSIEIEYNIPTLYLGLNGYSEILYRLLGFEGAFDSLEFREPDDTFSSVNQKHLLTDLRSDAYYEIKVKVHLELGGSSEPLESDVIRVETPFDPSEFDFDESFFPSEPLPAPTLSPTSSDHPSKMVVNAELKAVDLTANEATIQWRNFEQNERQLIDGIQLRYKNLDVNAQVFTMTTLLHRDVTSNKLEELMPSTMYEVNIIFMPFENQVIELISDRPIRFKTLNIEDPYNFNISLSATRIAEMSADLNWTGVPYPEDKYVTIYRVLFQGDGDPDTAAAFKLAKHDAPSFMTVKELKPGHKYRFWIEAYLTNGKVKNSNVIDVITKPGQIPKISLAGSGLIQSSQDRGGDRSDQKYFIAMTIMAVVAGCAILLVITLSIILLRRGTKATATITARKSQSAYDNPSYKNYESGEANGHRNKNLNDVL